MFKQLDLYLIKAIVASTLVVLLSLLSLDFLIRLIADVDHLGEKQFTLTTLLLTSFLFVPVKLMQFFPVSLIVVSLLGLGKLQSSSELIVAQTSGVSKFRISIIGVVVSFLLGGAVFLITEYSGYSWQKKAVQMRAGALGRVVKNAGNTGAWLLNDRDFVYVGGVKKTGEIKKVRIYRYTPQMILKEIISAKTAVTKENSWNLQNVTVKSDFLTEVKVRHHKVLPWKNHIDVQLVRLLVSDPDDLLTRELWEYIQYQQSNHIAPANYLLIFWQRLLMPLSSAVMFLLALPFVFSTHRSKGQGRRLFIGLLLGLAYYVCSSSISNLVLLTGIPVILGASLPPVIFAGIALSLLWVKK